MKKKWFVGIISLTMVVSMGAGAYAASNLTEIKAYLNHDIKVKVDGKPVQLQDEQGSVVIPITYKGTTYLPVRAVSNALDVAVAYDSETSSVLLGEKTDGVSIADGFYSMYHTKDPSKTSYKGKDYKDVYFDNTDGSRSSNFALNPKKKYQKLYLQVAAVGKDIEEISVHDSDTDTELLQTTVSIADGLKTIEVDIGGVDQLWVNAGVKDGGGIFIPLTTSYYK